MDLDILTKGIKLTETELQLLTYITNHLDSIKGASVREIAKKNYTSPATVVRLAQKLGFKGYLELYYYLNMRTEKHNTDEIIDFQINGEQLDGTIEIMKNYYRKDKTKFIFIYATGFSGIIAEYLQKKLLVNGIRVIFSSGQDSSGIIEHNVDNISMMIVISKSGETPKIIEKMSLCQKFQIPVVAFTSQTDSRVKELSDHYFEVTDDEQLDTYNRYYSSFFGKLLLLLEYIVQKFLA